MFSFAFTNFLLISTLCSPAVLGRYCSPAKGPTPPSVLYPLFFPALSDTASQAAYLLFPLLLYLYVLPSISLFLLISFLLPCATPAWSSLSSWISDFNSQLFFHHHSPLPEVGLILLTCKLILHGNLYLPDSVWSVCQTRVSHDAEHKLNKRRCTLI